MDTITAINHAINKVLSDNTDDIVAQVQNMDTIADLTIIKIKIRMGGFINGIK